MVVRSPRPLRERRRHASAVFESFHLHPRDAAGPASAGAWTPRSAGRRPHGPCRDLGRSRLRWATTRRTASAGAPGGSPPRTHVASPRPTCRRTLCVSRLGVPLGPLGPEIPVQMGIAIEQRARGRRCHRAYTTLNGLESSCGAALIAPATGVEPRPVRPTRARACARKVAEWVSRDDGGQHASCSRRPRELSAGSLVVVLGFSGVCFSVTGRARRRRCACAPRGRRAARGRRARCARRDA